MIFELDLVTGKNRRTDKNMDVAPANEQLRHAPRRAPALQQALEQVQPAPERDLPTALAQLDCEAFIRHMSGE